MNSKRYFPVVN